MKNLLFLVLLLILSCSKDNDEECEALYEQYITSLSNTGGSQAAIEEITRQYEERKADLGCN
ncbi:hypothetical protein [uncultured Winogradskyella sp.]|uniref:hypothetical protein n=1 Tax=uncultured Winogradskyella sp. TaxID=395353 RepID=UPI00262219EA|nr:hypothetical protein [uncultured Winogradskyella sp.]